MSTMGVQESLTRWPRRFPALALPAVGIFSLYAFGLVLPTLHHLASQQERALIEQAATVAGSTLRQYRARELAGSLTREEAQREAASHLRALRFGVDGEGFYWIHDLTPRMIAHPHRVDLEGRDLSGYMDSDGRPLFADFLHVASGVGRGFLDLRDRWQDQPAKVVPALSYLQLYPPWEWVVGCGLSDDRPAIASRALARRITVASFVLLLATALWQYIVLLRDARRPSRRRRRPLPHPFRAAFEQATEPMAILGLPPGGAPAAANLIIVHINRTFETLIGKPPTLVVGRPLIDHLPGVELPDRIDPPWVFDCPSLEQEMTVAGLSSDSSRFLLTCRRARPAASQESPWVHENHRLRARQRELEQLLIGITHDMKAPVIAIQGFSQLLRRRLRGEQDPKIAECLSRISHNAKGMENLLGELLTVSRAERRDEPPRSIDIRDMVLDLFGNFAVQVEEKEIKLSCGAEMPHVRALSGRIREVFNNLIDNAIRYTPRGGRVHVGFDPTLPCPDGRKGAFFVRDDGPGIAPEYHDRIFQVFDRGPLPKGSSNGWGMGLVIVKRIVEAHGGRAWVVSKPGTGAAFYVTLPRADEEPQHAHPGALESEDTVDLTRRQVG